MNDVALRANDVLRNDVGYDVAPSVQMKSPSANDVMLRINDVALCANGIRPLPLCAKI